MANRALLLLTLVVPVCLASQLDGPEHECAIFGRAIKAARGALPGKTTALELVKLVALGRNKEVTDEMAIQAGATGVEVRYKDFAFASVRECALSKLGGSDLPEAMEFLQSFQLADVGNDTGNTIWPAAQMALRDALLRRIEEPSAQTIFLEKTLTEPHDNISYGRVTSWAIDQLCDRGFSGSLPLIREHILRRNASRADEEIRFCEARMAVKYRDVDQVRALASLQSVDAAVREQRLTFWAIRRLEVLHSADADAALRRFQKQIVADLRMKTDVVLRGFDFYIEEMLMSHAK